MVDFALKPFVEGVIARSSIRAFSAIPDALTRERVQEVLERDGFACVECGADGRADGVELVVTYQTSPQRFESEERAVEAENLESMCADCLAEQTDVQPLVSARSSPSVSNRLADGVDGLNRFAASTNGWRLLRSKLWALVGGYILLVLAGGVQRAARVSSSASESALVDVAYAGMVEAALVPVDVFVWLPSNYPLVGFLAYIGLLYPVSFLLFEHSLFEEFRPRYHGVKPVLWLLGFLVFQSLWVPVYLSDLGVRVPGELVSLVGVQAGYGLLTVGGAGLLVAGVVFRTMLERVTYSDWTDTMLAAYQRADLNEYERNQLSVEDIEGVNFLPLVWLFLGRVSVYTQFYGVFLFEGALLVEVAMLVVPFVVGVGYLGWRSYQFQNVPMLTYVGQSVQDVSATTEEPSDIEDMETVPVGSEDGEGGGEGAEQGFGEW